MARKSRKKSGNGGIMKLAGLVVLVVALAVWYKFWSFNPSVTVITCSKDFALKADEPPVCTDQSGGAIKPDDIFSQERLIEYATGSGLEVNFKADNAPNVIVPAKVDLKKETSAQFDQPKRRAKVEEARGMFTSGIAKLKDPDAQDYLMEFYADVTGGFKQADRERLSTQGGKRIEPLLTTGNAVISMYGISRVDNLRDKGHITVAKGSPLKSFSDFVGTQLTDSAEEDGSAIATGLFNALKQNQGKPDRTIVIYSDMMENDSRTMNFYKSLAEIKDQKNWENIKTKLTALEPLPDLKGAKIFIVAPPNTKSEEFRAVLPFWTFLFQQAGATSVDHVI